MPARSSVTTPDYEKLGAFYLGRRYDAEHGVTDEDILYDAKDLTTHAVCVGMTGSGKTGLCVGLLEEAATPASVRRPDRCPRSPQSCTACAYPLVCVLKCVTGDFFDGLFGNEDR